MWGFPNVMDILAVQGQQRQRIGGIPPELQERLRRDYQDPFVTNENTDTINKDENEDSVVEAKIEQDTRPKVLVEKERGEDKKVSLELLGILGLWRRSRDGSWEYKIENH